jgi:hypothetical protein
MFMCVVNLKTVNKLDLTWKQSFLIYSISQVEMETKTVKSLRPNLNSR